jgi:serine/tyrosine/threonine adenylyltransferase
MASNPLLNLPYETALQDLGEDFFDPVWAAQFPEQRLRFRNDDILTQLGLAPNSVDDSDFIEAFGLFQKPGPFLALRYHGHQFGDYNPELGDGRGFLYGQVRSHQGGLYDLGTKGSGPTPYSRGGDGRLTLKGGVREVLAAEALHALGVNTSRCLSLIETGEALWRGDEPSPTRSSVMVRYSQSHIRFGTFERLDYLSRPDLITKLLDHVIAIYYPHLLTHQEPQARYVYFYAELVERVATLAAQWMSVGFCHAVLNTDNMSITGESFDYGPYAFIDQYNPKFTAAYFDYFGRYSFGNQPSVCAWNLYMLQRPLMRVAPVADLEASLNQFSDHYQIAYRQRMLHKLGFTTLPHGLAHELLHRTLVLLEKTQVGYHDFFTSLTQQFSPVWQTDSDSIFATTLANSDPDAQTLLKQWRDQYQTCLTQLSPDTLTQVQDCLKHHNPTLVLLRPHIETIWEAISLQNDWHPFYDLINTLQNP